MDASGTESRVCRVIVEQCNVEGERVSPDATLQDMGLDSLEAVELVIAIEQEFDVEIPDEDTPALDTPAMMAAYLDARARREPLIPDPSSPGASWSGDVVRVRPGIG